MHAPASCERYEQGVRFPPGWKGSRENACAANTCGIKAGSQYDAGPRVALRQHAMRSPASRRYLRVTVRCDSLFTRCSQWRIASQHSATHRNARPSVIL